MSEDAIGIKNLAVAVIKQSMSDLRAKSPCIECGKAGGKCEIIAACSRLNQWKRSYAEAELFFHGEGFEVFCNMMDFRGKYVEKLRKRIFKRVES